MRIIGYDQKYKKQIIACLKRNLKVMQNLSEEYLSEWIEHMTEYKWKDDIPIEKFPYKYGMILI